MSDTPAFEVVNPETGHRYKVWADGHIEGFGDATLVINRIHGAGIYQPTPGCCEIDLITGCKILPDVPKT